MEGLFNPTTILFHVINAALLLVAVYFLLYRPVSRFLKKREDTVASQLDGALQRETQAQELLEARQAQLQGAAAEVAEMIRSGEQRGNARAEEIASLAQKESRRIEDQAREHAHKIEKDAQAALYEKAANLSVDIAQMVLQREVTIEDHKRLLDEFFEKAGIA